MLKTFVRSVLSAAVLAAAVPVVVVLADVNTVAVFPAVRALVDKVALVTPLVEVLLDFGTAVGADLLVKGDGHLGDVTAVSTFAPERQRPIFPHLIQWYVFPF